MKFFGVMWIFCNIIPSPKTIYNLLFAQHLSKLAENGYWIFNYSWAIGTSNVDQNTAPTITNDDKSMQQRMKEQARIFATTHWKDFSNSIFLWNCFHATFLPFRSCLWPSFTSHSHESCLTILWNALGNNNSAYNEERLATSVQFLGIPKCWAVCKFDDLKLRVLRFFGPKKDKQVKTTSIWI
jgi:hypothetical protein